MNPFKRYVRWLHTGWPAGQVEKLPEVDELGNTAVPGVKVVGDLTGIPLLKFSADSGAKAVQRFCDESDFQSARGADGVHDVAIIGAGVSGSAAAMEAKKQGLDFAWFEAGQTFTTVKNFPKGKPIFTYPTDMTPAGDLQFHHEVKEALVADLDAQLDAAGVAPTEMRIERVERKGGVLLLHPQKGEPVKALRVVIGIGRSGNFRKLGVPGEERTHKVFNRLHDPAEFEGKDVMVVGGGDSAMEAAIALAATGASVTLSYRKPEFGRPKPENVAKLQELAADPKADVNLEVPSSERQVTALTQEMLAIRPRPRGTVRLAMASSLQEITDDAVTLKFKSGETEVVPNDVVFPMIGREPPLEFFRRSGIPIVGEWNWKAWRTLILFMGFCLFIYHWKSYSGLFKGWTVEWGPLSIAADPHLWFGQKPSDKSSLWYTLQTSMGGRSFYYTLIYSSAIAWFGFRRIKRRKTPYVRLQTYTLMAMQWLPLFLLPEIILPFMGRNGLFQPGQGLGVIADQLFPMYGTDPGERAYWRAYGLILAWPLMVYNWFTSQPIWGWLVLGGVQTFVIIPLIVRRWGKGAYCGWLCSCGALAETLGDAHRHKMPHGPKWNRLNLIGQAVLWVAVALLAIRIWGWVDPSSWAAKSFDRLVQPSFATTGWTAAFSYKYLVDVTLAGFLGVGFYFHYSGRVWCRFACPLAALMHIYARFTKFRIFPEKKKCISCNVCTSVCHQGIDIMSFANKGLPMEDPECVRCSACVQSCPTGVLKFGRYGKTQDEIIYDSVPASLVQMAELLGDKNSPTRERILGIGGRQG